MKPTIDLAVICVYNKYDKLNQYLIQSIELQNVNCEKVFIDNTKNRFSSAASALNYGASKANSKYLLFVHQDIVFNDQKQLLRIFRSLEENPSFVIGSAGIRIGEKGIFSTMIDGSKKTAAGSHIITSLTKCDVLDECLMACRKDVYEKIRFDQITCDYWDLYVVEFCLDAKCKGYSVGVVPLNVWHVSPGNPQKQFYQCMKRLLKKYRGKFSKLQTCCITIPVETNTIGLAKLSLMEKRNRILKFINNKERNIR